MKRLVHALLLYIIPVSAMAQIQTTMPFMSRLHQASYCNPAILPEYSTSVGTPVLSGLSFNMGLNGLNARTVLNSTDSKVFSIPMFYDNLKGNNIELDFAFNYELFHLRFKSKKWYYGIHLTTRTLANIRLSKEFVGLAAYGNDYYAGKAWDVSSTQVTIMAFNELGFSMARNYNRFNVGARAKMYQGVSVAQTKDFKLKLNQPQNPTDELSVIAGGMINTASIAVIADSINGRAVTESESTTDIKDLYTLKNLGTGIDFGLTYDVNNRLTVGVSVVDFGFINWTNKVYNYGINDVDVRFSGMNQEQLEDDQAQDDYLDSLADQLKPKITNNSFVTYMPWRFYLTGNYKLNKRNTIGAVVQGRYLQGAVLPAYTLSYSHRFGKSLDLTTNYSIIGNSYANIGLGWVLKMGVVQWYVVQDNILAYIKPDQFQFLSFRMGFNMVFGEIKRPLKVY